MSEKNRKSAENDEEKILPQIHKKQIKNLKGLKESFRDQESRGDIEDFTYGRETSFSNIWDNPADSEI